MERALLITVKLESEKEKWGLEDSALELEELVKACHAEAVDNIAVVREKPTPNLFIGKGKAQEIALLCQEENIDTVIFSHDLSGTHQRNLEEVIGKKTIDRTQLILDIFSRRARTPEGKMQVELAQLEYLFPRLTGKGIILSRLGGGIGTRGPGEQKLEVDRRRLRKRIDRLKKDLGDVARRRELLRKKRKDNLIPSIALVGYTNAGKSTLLNVLTLAGQVVSDSLFTTLDPLSKGFALPNGEHVILSDTVGFLHNLPHHLIDAFKATLEEVMQADLLIHVLDASGPLVNEHGQSVLEVLKELGAGERPMITALNKIDLQEDNILLEKLKSDFINPVAVSAKTGKNLNLLLEKIQGNFQGKMEELELCIPHTRMDLIDLFYREGKVLKIDYLGENIKIKLNLPVILSTKILSEEGVKKVSN